MDLNAYTGEDEKTAEQVVDRRHAAHQRALAKGDDRAKADAKKTPAVTEDDLYTRVLKYVPAPLIGLYLLLQNAVLGSLSGTSEQVVAWVVVLVFAVAVVIYLRQRNIKRNFQIVVSLLAYIAWAAASQGPFQLFGWWNELFGTLALGFVVLLMIVFKLKPLPKDLIEEVV